MLGSRAKIVLAAAAGACLCGVASAETVTYGFEVLEDNSPLDFSSQLSVSVSDHRQSGAMGALAPGQVSFKFNNIGALSSSIARIYFDDGTLLGIATVFSSTGVSMDQTFPGPGSLPGGTNVNFVATAGFSIGANAPPPANGVNNTATGTEWVEIVFNLINGKTYADTIAALNGFDSEGDGIADLRIGLHLIALADGGSETYINTTPPPGNMIPLPSTAGLAAAGLLMVGARRRR